jgi:hypothetical protein
VADQNYEDRFNNIERSLREIKERNIAVELNKSWEGSLFRKLIITVLTYMIIVTYMYAANIQSPWLNSIGPAVAFMLSTLTLPVLKQIWLKKIKQSK